MQQRISLILISAVALACLSTAAYAQVPLTLGARASYSIPMGDGTKNDPMSDGVSGAIPIQLDVSYRVNPNMYAGLYVSYGPGMAGKDLKDEKDLSISQLRYGFQFQYHTLPVGAPGGEGGEGGEDDGAASDKDIWGGLGVGFETATMSKSVGSDSASSSVNGLDIGLQGGIAWPLSPKLRVGPVVNIGIAKYDKTSFESSMGGKSESGDKDIDSAQQTWHQWISVGVSAAFSL